ncbi:MAG: hypothetical protein ACI8RD_000799 [Bacillariaceae sp.]|jgi:hypothetical protein
MTYCPLSECGNVKKSEQPNRKHKPRQTPHEYTLPFLLTRDGIPIITTTAATAATTNPTPTTMHFVFDDVVVTFTVCNVLIAAIAR